MSPTRHRRQCPTLADLHRRGRDSSKQEYLRCARCGPDPAAFKGATVHGLMLHMVQKHGGQQVFEESVAQLRNLDRAACVARDTIRSRRCHRCSHCKRDTPLRDLIVRRQPGHQEAALEGSPTVHQPFHSSQPVPPSDTMTARFQTAHSRRRPHTTRQAATRRSSSGVISRYATAWAECLGGAVSGHQS